jgi:replicative DNA helicase
MNPELAKWEAFAKEILQRCIAEEDPDDLRTWMLAVLERIEQHEDLIPFLLWLETFDFYRQVTGRRLEMASRPEAERKALTWPWSSWARLIDPLGPGMLGVITAPDGMGKTTYAECIGEHWAQHGIKVVYVHYELNHEVMLDRRAARHTGLSVRQLRGGRLTPAQQAQVAECDERLAGWVGGITYLHTPGWTMERTTAQLVELRDNGLCDAVILDYLEKVAPSKQQLKLFGPNQFQREAHNVEQLKTFAEQASIPVMMVAQMNKVGKRAGFDTVDRTGMRGAGEKSEFANLVVMLHRDRTADGYSDQVEVLVDKNTMGPTGTFKQVMQPEFFRVGDPYQERG